jgi:hypothetical protein
MGSAGDDVGADCDLYGYRGLCGDADSVAGVGAVMKGGFSDFKSTKPRTKAERARLRDAAAVSAALEPGASVMRLWLLQRLLGTRSGEAGGFVVRAESEVYARRHASQSAGKEGPALWLEPAMASCEELTAAGITGVVLQEFA